MIKREAKKNIVFDLGRVLVQFEPMAYVKKLFGWSEKTKRIYNAVFGNACWLDLDRGVIDEESAFYRMIQQANYPEEIRYLLYHWDEILTPMESTIQIVKRLKEESFSLYMLSNFHKRAYENILQKYAFFKAFDGILISSDTGFIKPEPSIYRLLFDKFSLHPSQCLFIDDTQQNIQVGQSFGMEGIVFSSAKQLADELVRRKILLSR